MEKIVKDRRESSLGKLLTVSPKVYGRINKTNEIGAYLSVYAVDDGRIEDITASICRVTGLKLCKRGVKVKGFGHCYIQAIAEELTSLLKFKVEYEQLTSCYI